MNSKLKGALVAGLFFFILSHPIVYKFVDSLIGSVASPSGCPTNVGLIVHAIVFSIATYYGLGL